MYFKMSESEIFYNKLIEENLDRGYQIRLVVNEFKGVIYFHLRKYFLTYEGDWQASREGISIPASLDNTYALLDGLFDVCSQAEGTEIIEKYYAKIVAEKST